MEKFKLYNQNGNDTMVLREDIKYILERSILKHADPTLDNLYNSREYQNLENWFYAFFNGNNKEGKFYTVQQAIEYLGKAKRASLILGGDLRGHYYSVAGIKHILETQNKHTIDVLANAYLNFFTDYDNKTFEIKLNENGANYTKKATAGMTLFVQRIVKKLIDIFDENAKQFIGFTEEKLAAIEDLSLLYQSLIKRLPDPELDSANVVVRFADEIIEGLTDNKFFKAMEFDTAKKVVETLTDKTLLGDNAFDKAEFKKLLSKTQSILAVSTKDQILTCQEILGNYRDYLFNLASDDEKFKAEINKKVTLKSLATKAGVILNTPTSTQQAIFKLLTGTTLGELQEEDDKAFFGVDQKYVDKYKNFKLNFKPYQLFTLLTQTPSYMLNTFTPARLYNMVRDLDNIFKKALSDIVETDKFEKSKFNIYNAIGYGNIVDILKTNVTALSSQKGQDNFVNNIHNLYMVMGSEEIFKVVQNNILFFLQDSKEVNEKMTNIINDFYKTQDRKTLTKAINDLVHTKAEPKQTKSRSRTSSVKSFIEESESDEEAPKQEFKIKINLSINQLLKTGLLPIVKRKSEFKQKLEKTGIDETTEMLDAVIQKIENSIYQVAEQGTSEDIEKAQQKNIAKAKLIVDHYRELVAQEYQIGKKNMAKQYEQMLITKLCDLAALYSLSKESKEKIAKDYPFIRRGKQTDMVARDAMSKTVIKMFDDVKANTQLKDYERKFLLDELYRLAEGSQLLASRAARTTNEKKAETNKAYAEHKPDYEYFARTSYGIKTKLLPEEEQTK